VVLNAPGKNPELVELLIITDIITISK
jgi:hypothetical protein